MPVCKNVVSKMAWVQALGLLQSMRVDMMADLFPLLYKINLWMIWRKGIYQRFPCYWEPPKMRPNELALVSDLLCSNELWYLQTIHRSANLFWYICYF